MRLSQVLSRAFKTSRRAGGAARSALQPGEAEPRGARSLVRGGASPALAECAIVVFAAAILASALTYPLMARFDHAGRVDNNDGRWSVWVVAWVAHALTTDPVHVYDANIFYPHTRTLIYSEANLVAGAVGAPVWALTKNPYATHNFVVLIGFVMSAVGMYYLSRHLTGSRHAAAVAAVLFAYCPFVFARTAHIQLLLVAGLPFCLLALHRLLERPTPGRAVLLGATIWSTGLTCAYYGIFGGLVVALGSLVLPAAYGRFREWRYWTSLGLAAALAAGLTAPFFIPYLSLQHETGFQRTLAGAQAYSADYRAWLASGAWAHRWWLGAIRGFPEVLFPGIATTALGVAGAWIGIRSPGERDGAPVARRASRSVALFYVLTAALAFWLTFGPRAGFYTLLYEALPVFSFLRAPGRAGIVVTLCLVVLASLALARLVESRRRKGLFTAVVFALAVADLVQIPIGLRDAAPPSAAHEALKRLPRAPVAVFPFWGRPIDFHGHADYMLASTVHWQPLINGYSDHIPQDFRDNAAILRGFPTREAFAVLERLGARYVVIHLRLFAEGRDDFLRRLENYQPYLRPLSKVDDTWLFEITAWPR